MEHLIYNFFLERYPKYFSRQADHRDLIRRQLHPDDLIAEQRQLQCDRRPRAPPEVLGVQDCARLLALFQQRRKLRLGKSLDRQISLWRSSANDRNIQLRKKV